MYPLDKGSPTPWAADQAVRNWAAIEASLAWATPPVSTTPLSTAGGEGLVRAWALSPHPHPRKKCLPWNRSLVPERMGTAALDHSRFCDFTRRSHRTQHIVVFTAKTYYSEKIQSKISTGKRCKGQSSKEIRYKLPKSPFSEVSQNALRSSSILWQCVKYCHPGKLLETQFSKILLEAGHVGTLCPHTRQNSKLLESRYSA